MTEKEQKEFNRLSLLNREEVRRKIAEQNRRRPYLEVQNKIKRALADFAVDELKEMEDYGRDSRRNKFADLWSFELKNGEVYCLEEVDNFHKGGTDTITSKMDLKHLEPIIKNILIELNKINKLWKQ